MKTLSSIVIRPLLPMVLFALICAGTSFVHAQEVRPERFRGLIVSVDLETQTLTVKTARGERSAQWDDASDIRGGDGIRTFDKLEVGTSVIVYMAEHGKIFRVRIRTEEE